MSALTLAQARQTLWRYAPGADGTFVPYASRTAADSLAVDNVINQVVQRFLTSGKWRGTVVRARFKVYQNQITLPSTLDTVLGITPIRDADSGEDGEGVAPMSVYSLWHEFLRSGPGNPTGASLDGVVDLGDGFPTFLDPSGTFTIKAYSDSSESSKTITFRGLDEDGRKIYTSGSEGVSLNLTTTPGNTTTQQFTLLSGWTKNAATTGTVRLYSVDATTSDETLICIIPPGKTVSGYRRYRVPTADWGDTVECLCKRAYVPAVADNDLIIPSHLGALKLGMMALQYEDRGDFSNASTAMAKAIGLLNMDREEFQGDATNIAIQFAPEYGAGTIPNIL